MAQDKKPLSQLNPKALIHSSSGDEMIDPTKHDKLRVFTGKPELVGEDTPWMRAQVEAGKLVITENK